MWAINWYMFLVHVFLHFELFRQSTTIVSDLSYNQLLSIPPFNLTSGIDKEPFIGAITQKLRLSRSQINIWSLC